MSERFFDDVDTTQSDAEVEAALEAGLQLLIAASDKAGEDVDVPLPAEDLSVLRVCAKDGGPKTRAWAVHYLFQWWECSWEDVESWILDPEPEVRAEVLPEVHDDDTTGGKLCASDKERCLGLLLEAAKRYPDDYWPAIAMQYLSEIGDEWLELTWAAADQLLALEDPEYEVMLFCCYYEHVVPDNGWGPDDPHIRPWIESEDQVKCRTLLNTAAYIGLDEGRLRDITAALTRVKDSEIAAIARGVLDGSVRYGEF